MLNKLLEAFQDIGMIDNNDSMIVNRGERINNYDDDSESWNWILDEKEEVAKIDQLIFFIVISSQQSSAR